MYSIFVAVENGYVNTTHTADFKEAMGAVKGAASTYNIVFMIYTNIHGVPRLLVRYVNGEVVGV